MFPRRILLASATIKFFVVVPLLLIARAPIHAGERLRVIVETDAGGDPDDEQSLVRFLLYANEWDVEGIICNRAHARDGENQNPERTGLGIARRFVEAYSECYAKLIQHDARYPKPEQLLERTVSGYEDSDEGRTISSATTQRSATRRSHYGSIRSGRKWTERAGITASRASRPRQADSTWSATC
jgi:hypothetical protein